MGTVFSRRAHFQPLPGPLDEALERRRSRGGSLIDLTESNPTRVGLGFPVEELTAALGGGTTALYDPDPLGLAPAREAIARYYAERGRPVDRSHILVTASTSEAYGYLFKLLCDPGDEVLVPAPSYPLFELLAGLEAVRPVSYPLRYDGEWHVDEGGLREALGPRARAIVVVSPNNPTGSFLKADELRLLIHVCQERGLALLCDEVFADYALAPDARRAPSTAGTDEVLTFTLSGMSKVAALPQLKIGWMAVSGPPERVGEAMQRLEFIADTYLSPNSAAQRATAPLLQRRGPVQERIRERLRTNLETVHALHDPQASWQPLRFEGGWTTVLRIPRTHSEQEWVRLLAEEEGVLVHPGYFFDFPFEGHLSLSLLPAPDAFRAGFERIAARLR